ncbi:MAG: hypothetical protein HQK54_06170 [Oligoflexales bacterium]|nr:hypothetical protein [Oligoflexales bacterium]
MNNNSHTNLGEIVRTDDESLTLKHPLHGEEYHSRSGAFLESVELYVRSSGFEEKTAGDDKREISVLDVGLGLGYNALQTVRTWFLSPSPPPLKLVSVEINRELPDALSRGNAPWIDARFEKNFISFCKALNKKGNDFKAVITHPDNKAVCHWLVRTGDATALDLSNERGDGFHFIWQDAFSPKVNPELWTLSWFKKLALLCSRGCILMTYSVAREVKDNLKEAGFTIKKIPALGSKRHWLKATYLL